MRTSSKPLGFSPGVAADLWLSDGNLVFAKAVLASWNENYAAMHRREAEITAALPPQVPTSRLLFSSSSDKHAILVLEHVAGRPPRMPWRQAELERVLVAVGDLSDLLTPSPLACGRVDQAGANYGFRDLLAARRVGGDPLADIDLWAVRNLERLVEIEGHWLKATRGNTLCHFDLRQDNILMDSRQVTFVDWPSAAIGPAWFDLFWLLPSVAAQGGPEPSEIFKRHRLAAEAPMEAVTTVVCALAGYFLSRQRMPAPPGIPTLRAFQRAQAGPALRWLKRRCELP
jgi:Ser/Thr protein kinase RdoA (MazF antagonist)